MESESYWLGNFDVSETCLFRLVFVSILAEPSFMNNSFLFRKCVKISKVSVNPGVLHWLNEGFYPKIKRVFKGSKLIYRTDVNSITALPNQILQILRRKLRSWIWSYDVFTIWPDFAYSEENLYYTDGIITLRGCQLKF